MNILILNWRDIKHPLSGGAEISLFEHAKYWRKKGNRVYWFSSSFNGAKKEEDMEGIYIIRRGSHYTVHLHALLSFIRKKFKKIDVVIDCFHFIPYFTPLYLKNKKIIALINEPAKNLWFKNILFPLSVVGYLLEPLFFIPYRKIKFITASDSIADELTYHKISRRNINVIPHGIKTKKTKNRALQEKTPVFIFLAQISPDKGIEDAVVAFYMVRETMPSAKLWVVGKAKDSKYFSRVKKIVERKGLGDHVKFFGYVSEQKKFILLRKAWVLIHPSSREGWGLNVIEANSVGTPAIGYNVEGLKDSIIHNKTGILTDTNPNALAQGVFKLLSNKKLYNTLSKNATKWAKNFRWEKSGEKSWRLLTKMGSN